MRETRPNVSDPGRIVAHRGASRVAPENTLAAFRAAAAQGVWWAEFDVSLLGDGSPVIHHDATFDRCTSASGALAGAHNGDLDGISAGRGHGVAFAAEPLPTLDQALDLLDKLGFHANLEMKCHDMPRGALATAVADALAGRDWTARRILVSSFNHAELGVLRRLMPDVAMAALWSEPPADWRAVLSELNACAIHVNFRHLSQGLMAEAESFGYDVRVYTCNEPRLMVPFRDLGLTGVITDHPPLYLDDPAWATWAES